MHPADEFEAFKALVDAGHSTADIAARRGCPESHVVKLLKLANCSPVLLKAYRDGKLEIDHLIAFAVTDDHSAQEAVFEQVGNSQPAYIRRLLIANEIPATDRRVRYVGLKAYEEAGGTVKRDLFSDEESGLTEILFLRAHRARAADLGSRPPSPLEESAVCGSSQGVS